MHNGQSDLASKGLKEQILDYNNNNNKNNNNKYLHLKQSDFLICKVYETNPFPSEECGTPPDHMISYMFAERSTNEKNVLKFVLSITFGFSSKIKHTFYVLRYSVYFSSCLKYTIIKKIIVDIQKNLKKYITNISNKTYLNNTYQNRTYPTTKYMKTRHMKTKYMKKQHINTQNISKYKTDEYTKLIKYKTYQITTYQITTYQNQT